MHAVLTRKYFLEEIDDQVPACVLHEILSNDHQATADDSYEALFEKVREISLEPRDCSWEEIAHFINPRVERWKWKNDSLAQAYRRLCQLAEGDLPISFEVGFQHPNRPEQVNLTLLYRHCFRLGIPTNREMTEEELERCVRLSQQPELLEQAISRLIAIGGVPNLISLLASVPVALPEGDFVEQRGWNEFPEHRVQIEESRFDICVAKFTTESMMIRPDNSTAAVILAALKYKIDLSYAKDPALEYFLLESSGTYQPHDDWMRYWWNINERIFHLESTFNPWFPRNFYRYDKVGEKLLRNPEQRGDPYEKLRIQAGQDDVFLGLYPGVLNEESPVSLELLRDYPSTEILTFRFVRSETLLYAILKEDLRLHFAAANSFITPFSTSLMFSEEVREKMKDMFQSVEFSACIDRLTTLSRTENNELADFREAYSVATQEVKSKVQMSIQSLIELSMYMRGWDGQTEYPIERAITPPEFFDQLLVNVTEATSNLEQSCAALIPERLDLRRLPLFCFRDRSYVISTDPNDGLTIGERLELIKAGESASNESSCIRISSNWLAASAVRILEQVRLPVPFDLSKMRYIL